MALNRLNYMFLTVVLNNRPNMTLGDPILIRVIKSSLV